MTSFAGAHLFPVRHHSPRSSAVLSAFLAEVRPKAVLIEAPEDALKILSALVDPGTRPPVAILGYRTDGVPSSALWPFAAYSPEYVAAKWGYENGARVGFIDIPVHQSLGVYTAPVHEHRADDPDIEGEEAMTDSAPPSGEAMDVHSACAAAFGLRSFEEFWEASFEAPNYDMPSFRAALLAYADLVRAADRSLIHRARDAFMAARIEALVRAGVAPESIVVVVGAAHAAALAAGDIDPSLLGALPEPVQTEVTLIPFSYPRLAEQLGYGAGNRAPQYYQRAHEAGCSYTRATLEVLIEFTEHLRLRGFMASLADTIEAYRLAVSLAGLRGKAEPGLDEVREATIAVLCRGDATHVDGFLWPSVIGKNVGRVAGKIARNSLQEEFWREVTERRLPRTDSVDQIRLRLTSPADVETSVFLHRLRIAEVPYAAYIGPERGARPARSKAKPAEEPGGLAALGRVTEAWETRWTPSTDVALIERIVYGNTLEEVASLVLRDRLHLAKNTGDAAEVLLEAVVVADARTVPEAFLACDRRAAGDDDLGSLSRAARAISSLVAFGSSRALSSIGDDTLRSLAQKTFDRAVLRVASACTCDDDAIAEPKAALRRLHEVALARPFLDRGAWFDVARLLASDFVVHPSASGFAAGLLYLAELLGEEEMVRVIGLRLSASHEPSRAASFLEGFLEIEGLALVKSRPVVAMLDAFLTSIDKHRFRDTLPVLRRAFSSLGGIERRYLLENMLAVRKIGDKAGAAKAVLLERDKEKLKAMSADLAQSMDDLDDLLT